MPLKPAATVKYTKTEMFISTPYNAEFVTAIKSFKTRRWNPKTKEWTLSVEEKTPALYMLEKFFDVTVLKPIPRTKTDAADEFLPCFDNSAKFVPGKPVDAWIDGACDVNPGGTGGYGLVIKQGKTTLVRNCAVSGSGPGMTNNVAEYCGLIALLEWCKANNIKGSVLVHSDSDMLINQISGKWKTKTSKGFYFPYLLKARALLAELPVKVDFEWIPREQNTEADTLSKQARLNSPQNL